MWISSIELTNFKSYAYQNFEFPEPSGNKNIVLIGGMNGYGKTTILEALYLGLYGKDSIAHLGRAGLKGSLGYKAFLKKALNGMALENGQDMMAVKIQIYLDPLEGYQISRTWFFLKNGELDDEELSIFQVSHGIKKKTLPSESLEEILGQYLVPAHLAPFFFFDGEEAKRIAEQNREEQLRQGMENLLGVVLIRGLQSTLKTFQMVKMKDIHTVDKKSLDKLLIDINLITTKIDDLRNLHSELIEEATTLKSDRSNIVERIIDLGGGGGELASLSDIIQKQSMIENDLSAKESSLEDVLCNKVPLNFVESNIFESFKSQLKAEEKYIDWQNELKTMEPKREKLFDSFFDEQTMNLKPPFTDVQIEFLNSKLSNSWSSLFFPPPDDAANEIVHSYLTDFDRNNLKKMLSNIRVGSENITNLINDISSLKEEIIRLEKFKNRIEGIDKSGVLKNLQKEHQELNDKIELVDKTIGSTERELRGLESDLDDKNSTYIRQERSFIESSPVTSVVIKADKVCKLIEELVPSLYKLKLKQLEKAIEEIFKDLSHKKKIGNISISENGVCKIVDQDGQEIFLDKSAGENQLFATALLGGLASVSGVNAPMVVDTPMGRLDSQHRTNILNYWISNKNRQIILLSQDTEINSDYFRIHKDKICKSYLLIHKEVRPGEGRTQAIENMYFGESDA